jgi:hypothetical protein
MTRFPRHLETVARWLLLSCCFCLLPAPPALAQNYLIRALGPPPTNPAITYASSANAVNNKDEVLAGGVFGAYSDTPSMFLLQPDYGMPAGLNYLPFFGVTNMKVLAFYNQVHLGANGDVVATAPQSFNDQGQILGTLMSPTNACVWQDGEVTSLGSLGGGVSYPFAINQNGDVIGYSTTAPGDTNLVPFVVLEGTTNMLPIAGFDTNTVLIGFNSQRQILFTTNRNNYQYGPSLWQNGQVQTLASIIGVTINPPVYITNQNGTRMPADGTYTGLTARSLNDNGEIHGYFSTQSVKNGLYSPSLTLSFYYSPMGGNGFLQGVNYNILQSGNDASNVMISMNNSGEIIYLSDYDTFTNAYSYDYYLWDNGQSTKIQNLVPVNSDWTDLLPYALNDRGDIIGQGYLNGVFQAFLLYLPDLNVRVSATPEGVHVGDQISVTVTAINNNKVASGTLTDVEFSLPIVIGGTGGVEPQSSVTPPPPATLAPGQTVSFTEDYIATTNGTVTFSASASGNDAHGNPVDAFGTDQVAVGSFSETGHIYCACDSNVIAGATVEIGTNSASTGPDGAYTITNLAPMKYTVTISAPKYQTFVSNLNVTMDGTNDYYVTNGTFLINPIIDSSITSLDDSDAISNTIVSTVQAYSHWIKDPLCVKILYIATNTGLGASYTLRGIIGYSQYVSDLQANTNMSANDVAALSTLSPTNSGIPDMDLVSMTSPLLDAIGEHEEASSTRELTDGLDSQVYLNFEIMNVTRPGQDPTKYDLQCTVAHETDEALGIGGAGSTLYLATAYSGQTPTARSIGPLDLYRYQSPGVRSFSLAPNVSAYFSKDAGTNDLVDFNQYANGSDYGDWGNGTNPAVATGNVPPQVQDAFDTPGTASDLGPNEFIALDIVGYTLLGTTTVQAPVYQNGTFAFTIVTLPGLTYQVQYKTSLAQNSWQNYSAPFVATGLTAMVSDDAATGVQRYYRIITLTTAGAKPQAAAARRRTAGPTTHLRGTALAVHHFLPAIPQNNLPMDPGSRVGVQTPLIPPLTATNRHTVPYAGSNDSKGR